MYLLSEHSSMVNGTFHVLDGGLLANIPVWGLSVYVHNSRANSQYTYMYHIYPKYPNTTNPYHTSTTI